MDDYNWIVWVLATISVLITIAGSVMMLDNDPYTKLEGQRILVGWWSSVAAVLATTLAMTFVIKPFFAWLFDLIF